MSTKDTRDLRPLVLMAVFLLHGAVILVLIRAGERGANLFEAPRDSLVFLLLPDKPRETPKVAAPSVPPVPHAKSDRHHSELQPVPESTITNSEPSPSRIDLEREIQLAVQNALANAEKERNYRNLAALSAEQLKWVRENQLAPATPGIPWTYRRVEVTQGGFPIIHINDHCIVIPLMMMMVFCKIGHIEPRGDLFNHMESSR